MSVGGRVAPVGRAGPAGRMAPPGRVAPPDGPAGPPAAARVVQADGRSKAYRPLPAARRATALEEGLLAYERGDFFLAHEHLEPAWMGTADPAERAFIQGLIKLAAADVHGVRGNALGVARNLDGALVRLRQASDAGLTAPDGSPLESLINALERRVAKARRGAPTGPTVLPWRA